MKKDIVEFPEEKKRSGFYLRFIACFIILSLLELGAYHAWSFFKNPVPAESTAVLSGRSQFHGEKGCLEITTPFGTLGGKSVPVVFILAALLNVLISYAAAWRADRPETVGELIRCRCKGRIKYIS